MYKSLLLFPAPAFPDVDILTVQFHGWYRAQYLTHNRFSKNEKKRSAVFSIRNAFIRVLVEVIVE